MLLQNIPSFIFVIDTDQYAGNFERTMFSHITGIKADDSRVGDAEVALFQTDYPDDDRFALFLMDVPDSRGTNRPVSIWPSPMETWFNNGIAGGDFLNDGTHEEEAQQHYVLFCLHEARREPFVGWRREANQEHRDKWLTLATERFQKNPSYFSVAIFLATRPDNTLITVMMDRARLYGTTHGIHIYGFRLLKPKLLLPELPLLIDAKSDTDTNEDTK